MSFSLKGSCQFINLLILQHGFIFSDFFSFFKLNPMGSFKIIRFFIFFMQLFVQIILPFYLSMHKLFFQTIKLLLCPLGIFIGSFDMFLKFLFKMFILILLGFEIFGQDIYLISSLGQMLSSLIQLVLQYQDLFFENLSFRLKEFGFFFFVSDKLLHFLLKFLLN